MLSAKPLVCGTVQRPRSHRRAPVPVKFLRVSEGSENNSFVSEETSAGELPLRQRVNDGILQDVVTMFKSFPYEYSYSVPKSWVSGKLPSELQGTYLRNGPGLQVCGGRHQRHFMDGDGCIISLTFPGGEEGVPYFQNRYVRTQGFVEEQAAGKPLFRNAFTRGAADGSPVFNPFDLSFKNVANTGVLYWAGKVWALWEVGRPYELHPNTLETIGESDMGGQIGPRLAGHYRTYTEADGSLRCILFGAQISFQGMHLEFYEMDEGGKVLTTGHHPLHGLDIMFIHDMVVTEHFYIILMGPIQLDVEAFLTKYVTSQLSLAELLRYNKELDSKIILFPRPGKHAEEGKNHKELRKGGSKERRGVGAAAGAAGTEAAAAGAGAGAAGVAAGAGAIGARAVGAAAGGATAAGAGQAAMTAAGAGAAAGAAAAASAAATAAATYSQGMEGQATHERRDGCQEMQKGQSRAAALQAAASTKFQKLMKNCVGASDNASQDATSEPAIVEGITIPAPALFSFHHVNAFEEGDGQTLIMDTISWEDFAFSTTQYNVTPAHYEGGSRSHLYRLIIDIPSATLVSCTRQLRRTVEFPAIHNQRSTGKPYCHAYFAGDAVDDPSAWGPPQSLLKVTRDHGSAKLTETEWTPGPRSFLQEPYFIPRPGGVEEDDGWIIVAVHNASSGSSNVAILDAKRVEDGPLASIHFPHPLPFGLHGTWTTHCLAPDPRPSESESGWMNPRLIKQL